MIRTAPCLDRSRLFDPAAFYEKIVIEATVHRINTRESLCVTKRSRLVVRANGPAVCPAQPGGLGTIQSFKRRANGPAVNIGISFFALADRSIFVPQSHAQVWLHIVFSTKHRQPFLKSTGFRDEMNRMLAYHVKQTGCVVGNVGGHVDHVHLLVGLSRTLKICTLIEVIKTETSKWAKGATGGHSEFSWQAGYGAFSVSYSNLEQVQQYIQNRERHHSTRSYQEEFRVLCKKHGIEIDERYVRD